MSCTNDLPPPQRAVWEPGFTVGHALLDAQHQGLLAACNQLADLCTPEGGGLGEQAFDQGFDRLKALAREHFEAEAAVLASQGYAELEDHRIECEEFEYLADEIVTAENFDRVELQRFLALWCVGHIVGSAEALRAFLAGRTLPPA